jgi:hypothetical protein
MTTPKENFLRLMRGDNPKWLGDPFECFNCNLISGLAYLPDAVSLAHRRAVKGEIKKKDAWGVIWDWPADQPGPTPNHTGGNVVIKDITRWKEYFDFPSLDNLDWTETWAACGTPDRENKLVMIQSARGLFEFSHAMMGFEDALMNYLLEPDAMFELLSAYTDWKIKGAGLAIDEMRPDIIVNFDDWGNKTQLFLPPRVWREILKPLNKRFFDYIKSRGVIVMNHCDCHAEEICEDMAEIGMDIWQGPTPENDIPEVIKRTGGKLFLLGGIDMSAIDFPGAGEELIRAHIRSTFDKYVPCGYFLPCFTSWLPVNPHVASIGRDEMNRYGNLMAEKLFGG